MLLLLPVCLLAIAGGYIQRLPCILTSKCTLLCIGRAVTQLSTGCSLLHLQGTQAYSRLTLGMSALSKFDEGEIEGGSVSQQKVCRESIIETTKGLCSASK